MTVAPAIDVDEIVAGEQAAAYINGLIRGPAAPSRSRSHTQAVDVGRRRMERMRRFLRRLGDPHLQLRVVHVGGTSGKGSVATKIAAALSADGQHSGLHVTPYLQTPLEKLWVDGRLARPGDLAELVDWIKPHVRAAAHDDPDGPPTYGMVWVALTFEYFRREAVDVLVLEVGAGGRFDLTNVVRPVLSVVTSVGLDHRKTLGGTLESIAWHKAGIFKPGIPAVIGRVPGPAARVLEAEAARVGAALIRVLDGDGPASGFPGANTALAQRALGELQRMGLAVAGEAARDAAGTATPPGRFERMPDVADIVLDGAHNADKAAALRGLLDAYAAGRPVVMVAGVVGYRGVAEILAPLLPGVQAWVASEPRVFGKAPAPVERVAQVGASLGRPASAQVPDPRGALRQALRILPDDGVLLVAGSLYLVGNVRTRWYPTEAVVRTRSMWPAAAATMPLRHT
jgi:dihydrofolate synthase/folylpolyglutamate synthase